MSPRNAIVPLDPSASQLVEPKPLIADILRTRYCVPGSVFLVEAIERRVPVSASAGVSGDRRRRRAVRMILGDGELCIQALVRPEIHCFVDSGMVYEGCYVRVDKFELRRVGGEGGMGGKGEGGMVYLVVGDLVTVGWNEEYLEILRGEGVVGDGTGEGGVKGEEDDDAVVEALQQLVEREALTEAGAAVPEKAASPTVERAGSAARKPTPDRDVVDPDYMSDSDDAFETLEISMEKADQRRIAISAPKPQTKLQAEVAQERKNHGKALPWMPNDPTQALKLTLLRSIPHLPYKQNWMVNVLAVVVSLSDVQPAHIPPYRQRTARLADPSTTKHVHFATFLDPEGFTPAVGSVVLLLGVKNHLFDGGSLRKYVSDRPKNGSSWWIQHPEALGWCEEDVARLTEWWQWREQDGDGR